LTMSVFSKFCIAAVAVATQGALAGKAGSRTELKVSADGKKVQQANEDVDFSKAKVNDQFVKVQKGTGGADDQDVETYTAEKKLKTVKIGSHAFTVTESKHVAERAAKAATYKLTVTETSAPHAPLGPVTVTPGDSDTKWVVASENRDAIAAAFPAEWDSTVATEAELDNYNGKVQSSTAPSTFSAVVTKTTKGEAEGDAPQTEETTVAVTKQGNDFVLSGTAFAVPVGHVIKNPKFGQSADLKKVQDQPTAVKYSAVVTEVKGSETHQLTLTAKEPTEETLHEVAVTKTQEEGAAAPVWTVTGDDKDAIEALFDGAITGDVGAITGLEAATQQATITEESAEEAAQHEQQIMTVTTEEEIDSMIEKATSHTVQFKKDGKKWVVESFNSPAAVPAAIKGAEMTETEFEMVFRQKTADGLLDAAHMEAAVIAQQADGFTWYMVAAPKTDKKSLMQEPLFWGLIAAALAVVLVIFFMVCKGDSSESDDESDSSDSDFSDDESDAEAAKSDAGAASGASTPKNNDA